LKAIAFDLDITKLLTVRFGESSFKKVDEFWTDFTPQGGEKTTIFLPNIVKHTVKNEQLVLAIQENYRDAKEAADAYDKKMYELRNQFEK